MAQEQLKQVKCAGGVASRGDRLLLIKKRGQFAIPKGHPHGHEKLRQTAMREVHEETGYWAEVLSKLGTIVRESVEDNGKRVEKHISVFLMAVARDAAYTPDQKALWVPYDEAVQNMRYAQEGEFLVAKHDLIMASIDFSMPD